MPKNFHMFQLNSYKNKTHLKWIFSNYIKCYRITKNKNSKKPIVYTRRLVTMIIAIAVIQFIVICLGFLTECIPLVLLVLFLLTPFYPIIGNIFCSPIEKAYRRYYINDAKHILKEVNPIVIGITGSYGKTSVKYFLTTLLQAKYETLMTPESFNTPMGVVKTIREQMRPTCQIFVCEMGARQEWDIKEICDIVNPKYGIITSIGEQHLETFKSIDTIIKTKFELAESAEILFLNGDNSYITAHLPKKTYFLYGLNGKDYKADNIKVTLTGTTFGVNEYSDLQVKLVGEHNIQNLNGAIAVALYLGVDIEDIRTQLRKIVSPPHRLELKRQNGVTILDDAYNSNPAGCLAALKTLSLFEGLKILITPGMVELGEKQNECNRIFGEQAAEVCDYVYLIGKKQTVAIYEGLKAKNYSDEKIIILEDVRVAINKAMGLEGEKIILLENDLPDNFL
jgi:UDP-N-acetylmuramoyl-tripeptide--D-alanyl-D-alanine ligase